MATRSIALAWRTPGTGEPGALPSVASHRIGHDSSDLAAAAAAAAGTTYKWNHIFFFCSWHFICVMLIAEYFFVSINRILFIHFFYCWTVGLFAFFLSIVNNAATAWVCLFESLLSVLLRCILGVGLLDHMEVLLHFGVLLMCSVVADSL